jgi:UDP:flavonoid glycosyltransferase YjiC (YdhE family)
MLRDLLPIVVAWPPDLVVHDAAEFAGPIIAAKIGVPTVTKSYGMLLPRQRVVAAADHAADLWRSVDLEPVPFGGCYQHLYLNICPPALQPMLPSYIPRRQLLRPLSHDSIASEPDPSAVDWPSAFPAVYLTLGTVFKNTALLRGAVNALADLGVSILVTVGSGTDPTEMGPQPRHVRVESYVPQSLVMSRCRVVVSHGGSGTAFAALSHGVPQLCLPQGADQFLNANAIARAGAGLQLITEVFDGGAIVNAVGRLLNEPSFRSAAEVVAAEISQMPHPDDVASAFDQLVTR